MLISEEKMAGSDRRTQKTVRAIKEELLRQMLYKKYNELTVSGICAALDISRRTFYLHFYGIDDVFEKIFDDINQPVYRKFGQLLKAPASERPAGSSIAPSGRKELIYEIFDLLKMTQYGRVDMIYVEEKHEFWFIEANNLPGMTNTSLLPEAAKVEGLAYEDLCEQLVLNCGRD